VKRKPKSKIAEAFQETATDLFRVGLIDWNKMREIRPLVLTADRRRTARKLRTIGAGENQTNS
jgi:hypothetical protein